MCPVECSLCVSLPPVKYVECFSFLVTHFQKPIKNYLKWCVVYICVLTLSPCDWICGPDAVNMNHVAIMLLHMQTCPCARECKEHTWTRLQKHCSVVAPVVKNSQGTFKSRSAVIACTFLR